MRTPGGAVMQRHQKKFDRGFALDPRGVVIKIRLSNSSLSLLRR
jgi:hypothetical protein